jgi:hypothetical protein
MDARSDAPQRPFMQWRFFFGACFLTAAGLLPHAPLVSLLAGMGLAAAILYAWHRAGRGERRP